MQYTTANSPRLFPFSHLRLNQRFDLYDLQLKVGELEDDFVSVFKPINAVALISKNKTRTHEIWSGSLSVRLDLMSNKSYICWSFSLHATHDLTSTGVTMDGERVSLSNNASQQSKSWKDKISRCYATTKHHDEGNVICLESVPAICVETSDEEDASEQPLFYVERTKKQPRLAIDPGSAVDRERESAFALGERTQTLWLEMMSLREELNRELTLWKKESEEFQLLRERSNALAFQEATAAARAAAAAYAIEAPLSNGLGNVDIASEQSVRELAILEYERDLAKYQDLYASEQAEKRYNAYKCEFVDAYKRKLLEVEHLCSQELERIRESAICLQPFKEIASQWSAGENDRGDANRDRGDPSKVEQSRIAEANLVDKSNRCFKIHDEVDMAPEILSALL